MTLWTFVLSVLSSLVAIFFLYLTYVAFAAYARNSVAKVSAGGSPARTPSGS